METEHLLLSDLISQRVLPEDICCTHTHTHTHTHTQYYSTQGGELYSHLTISAVSVARGMVE